ncbi:folylpolyglutamate synthase [Colletotrichum scovillei]|uniref:tetrahydrofolate synthase n=1 Tax=Colletotrichum scovillei TaxID=1209932 RepID=A0A9P7QSB2_9PEZI|nr:folylpolyglutamate synthase [Colletotrichum scovillei]KAG7040650.1 folylpolyglutamate synthase [Colletotrichum scovillei]KAG7060697.1 folylpolyglutamate synthase [Colletotrichum scovillei]
MREDRTYQLAIELLRSRRVQRSAKSSAEVPLPKVSLPNGSPNFKGTPHIYGMKEWLKRLGHTEEHLNRLNVIHVAGTKGKGSTCTYVDSFLRSHSQRTGYPRKRGLYMSPFLDKHNEMIRIDSIPLSDARFAEAFFEVWDGLRLSRDDAGTPRQLQILAILSFHVFLKEEVDVAIYETHHGGQFDVTNIVERPIVTAITSIGLDHQAELGESIQNIAWHKAGIFKSGACALSVPQMPAAEKVLQRRARDLGVDLEFVGMNQDMTGNFQHDKQKLNASLARKACDAFLLCKRDKRLTQEDIENGIRGFTLPGRFQVVQANGVTWCLDGAHNPMSASISAAWFRDLSKQEGARNVVMFGIDSDRHDPDNTLRCLRDILGHSVSCVILTSDTGALDEDRLNRYPTPFDLIPNLPGLLEQRVGVGSPEAEG